MTVLRALALIALPGLLGCLSAEEQRLEDACGASRPDLDSCERGLNWVDCDGTEAEPRFGCNESSCAWFAGGCVPEGYRASECPADDLCCEDDGGRTTPFRRLEGNDDWLLTDYFTGWGSGVWSAEREAELRSVDVVLGSPEVVEGGESVCTGTSDSVFADICRCEVVPPGIRTLGEDGFSIFLMPPCAAIVFAYLHVKVTRESDGTATAWVCHEGTTDIASSMPCAGAREPVCAESGTLTIERWPETEAELGDMPIELDVLLDDGRTMELRF